MQIGLGHAPLPRPRRNVPQHSLRVTRIMRACDTATQRALASVHGRTCHTVAHQCAQAETDNAVRLEKRPERPVVPSHPTFLKPSVTEPRVPCTFGSRCAGSVLLQPIAEDLVLVAVNGAALAIAQKPRHKQAAQASRCGSELRLGIGRAGPPPPRPVSCTNVKIKFSPKPIIVEERVSKPTPFRKARICSIQTISFQRPSPPVSHVRNRNSIRNQLPEETQKLETFRSDRMRRGSFQLQVRFSPPHASSDLVGSRHAQSRSRVS